MPVGLAPPQQLYPVKGIRLAACHSGIKADAQSADLTLIEIAEGSTLAAVFTRNRFCAAPVQVARDHLQQSAARYLLINSGNANAGTGQQGMADARQSCQHVSTQFSVPVETVLPFSTGVIGAPLAVDRIAAAIPALAADLSEDQWLDAARGIMTTDTIPKAVSRQLTIDGQTISITGISKGSGMIRPDMATMLAYVATDARIDQQALDSILSQAVEQSFNAITVDGDTSTNDACVLMATGHSQVAIDADHGQFIEALNEVFRLLAQAIVRDGEGATKFVEINVANAADVRDARQMAYTIAHSPLVKTALFASDANWGRILAAIGRAEVSRLDIERVNLYLGDVCLIERGLPDTNYREELGQREMSKQDIVIRVDLGLGDASARVWTTDLSYEYVKINAEYRS
ncbi:MAG: bifunctional glutamate N-acetyltransferase/amino-acid acetyltransferase ArgJ [Gammaproteobacteria bacterium]|nr:bifunctional glutamate N-acetyltransferase/amino-acid acetyltransferase ArgJ [Gammaproteobacteria bacterium]